MVQALRDEGPDGEERVANLEELIAGAADLQRRLEDEDPELMDELEEIGDAAPRAIDLFLGHVALVADIDQHDPQAEAVSLMTLHNAKGLEFPYVFITGLEDGLFPMARAYDEAAQMEEERRLFYVGITRAERKLYLVNAKRRRRGAQWMDSVPSPFLESIPEELTETRRTARIHERTSSWSQPWKYVSPEYRARSERIFGGGPVLPKKKQPVEDEGYQVDYSDSQDAPRMVKGARVRHPQFGSGTVAELSGGGRDVRATIDFDDAGRKTVVLRFANLERDWD